MLVNVGGWRHFSVPAAYIQAIASVLFIRVTLFSSCDIDIVDISSLYLLHVLLLDIELSSSPVPSYNETRSTQTCKCSRCSFWC